MKNIKYLKLLAALLAMNGILCTSVAHASDDEDEKWEYDGTYYDDMSDFYFSIPNTDSYGRALSDEIRISWWHGNDDSCTIPSTITLPRWDKYRYYGGSLMEEKERRNGSKTFRVVEVADRAFEGCDTLITLAIQGNPSIGSSAFKRCTSLESVSMPNVTSIGGSAFDGCTSLTSVSMPNVTSIGGSAFYGCGSIKEVYVPQCAMERGLSSVFSSGYSTIQHLVMDGTVSSIADNVFSGCKSLTNIEVDVANAHYFVSPLDGCLYDRDQTTLLCCPRNVTDILIPYGVTKIGNYAFAYCSNLVSVTMPVTLKEIGENAFLDCVNLPSVALPDSVTKLCSGAFRNCRKLHGVTIPFGVRALDTSAFDGCDVLWTEWYRALADFAVNGRAYDLTRQPGDRAIADVTVDGDMALDAFVLKNGKVYDSVLYIQNIADHSVRVTLPTMPLTGYKTFKGVSPLTLPAYSTSILTITRVAGGNAGGNEFLVTREELETVQ